MLSRRAVLAAAAAAALTAGCEPDQQTGPSPRRSAAAGSATASTATTTTAPSPSSATPSAPLADAPEVRHGSRTRPDVALTFHGSGDPALAVRLLDLLERHQVRASVLAVGIWLRAEPRMADRITRAGHDLGNHTLHHYPMRTLSAATTSAEVRGCSSVLRRLTGTEGRWFRASGTQATTPRIRRAAARAGYQHCISYDVDGLDWQDPAPDTVTRAVFDGARNGSIISLHLGHPVTLAALPDVLQGLRHAGLTPVTLTDLLA